MEKELQQVLDKLKKINNYYTTNEISINAETLIVGIIKQTKILDNLRW